MCYVIGFVVGTLLLVGALFVWGWYDIKGD